MQILYAMNRDKQLPLPDALKVYRQSTYAVYEAYIYNLLILLEITQYALKDEAKRKAKHLPSDADRLFSAKLSTNAPILSIKNNIGFQQLVKAKKMTEKIDKDNIRVLYQHFSKSKIYIKYLQKKNVTEEGHIDIILELYKQCIHHELFNEMILDFFATWDDDESLIVGVMKKSIKALPVSGNFYDEYQPAHDSAYQFGIDLLRYVSEKGGDLLTTIKPALDNWDADRVAILDMIILKMALKELVDCPTIPTKVTLNEYVEIAKLYSTDKSKEFVNGVLDRLKNELNDSGKIKKEGRGLID